MSSASDMSPRFPFWLSDWFVTHSVLRILSGDPAPLKFCYVVLALHWGDYPTPFRSHVHSSPWDSGPCFVCSDPPTPHITLPPNRLQCRGSNSGHSRLTVWPIWQRSLLKLLCLKDQYRGMIRGPLGETLIVGVATGPDRGDCFPLELCSLDHK